MNRLGFRMVALGVFLFLVSLTGSLKTYAIIVLCVNTFFSFGNGVLGFGLEQKHPIAMTMMELKIFKGTASVAERIVNFFWVFFFGVFLPIIHVFSVIIFLVAIGLKKLVF